MIKEEETTGQAMHLPRNVFRFEVML